MTPEEKAKNRAELKAKLREKISGQKLTRNNKKHREEMVDKSLEKMGIDRKKLQESYEIIRKSGGKLSLDTE